MKLTKSNIYTYQCSHACRTEGCPGHAIQAENMGNGYVAVYDGKIDVQIFDVNKFHAMVEANNEINGRELFRALGQEDLDE